MTRLRVEDQSLEQRSRIWVRISEEFCLCRLKLPRIMTEAIAPVYGDHKIRVKASRKEGE
jgi:hypothetical protein